MATFGAAKTNLFSDNSMNALGALAGSKEGGQQAAELASLMYPEVPEADPWMAAFKFFQKMGEISSQPGSTALTSGLQSTGAAMDYLQESKAAGVKQGQDRLKAGISAATSLKPAAGKGLGTYSQYLLKSPQAIKAYEDAGFGLTQEQRAGTDPVQANSALVSLAPTGFLKYTPSDGSDAGAPGMKADETGIMRYTGYNLPKDKKTGDRVFDESILEGFTENENKLATTLRKDLTAALKEFIDIDSSMKNINSFYFEAQEQANPISDYSLAVQYAKIIDPGTAAREGEVAAIASAGSLSGALRAGLTNAILGTGKLSQRMRASIFNNSIKIYDSKLPNALSTIERYKTQSEEVATGLFKFVGLNIPRNEEGKILFKGVGGNPIENPNNYQPVDLTSITDDPIDNDPTAIFPPDHSFDGYSLTTLLGFLALPPDTLDRETLDKIQKALENLQ